MSTLKDPLPYDKTSPEDILRYSKLLEGTTFKNVLDNCEPGCRFKDDKGKGRLGQLLEECHFFYMPNSDMKADFEEAGVELKTSPIKKLNNGEIRAKERIVLNMIDYRTITDEQWHGCSMMKKNALLLFVFYLFEKNKKCRLDYEIKKALLWKLKGADLEIIRQDWKKIVKKIKDGKAHELSEGDTIYLGACTKGADGKRRKIQPFSDISAKPRAFSLKQCYINSIISRIIDNAEPAIKAADELKDKTFEEIILSKLDIYSGMAVDDIDRKVGYMQKMNAKQHYAMLAARMLGLKKDKIAEFEKGDISIKTIRLKKDGTPAESMSFPAFKYLDLVKVVWEDSRFYEFLTKRFFFMVFQEDDSGILRFKKCMFWAMPSKDLEEAKTVWEETKRRVLADISDFPKISENRVSHVRPHGRNKDDTYESPSGKHWTKKCFWLNAKYIKEQIEK